MRTRLLPSLALVAALAALVASASFAVARATDGAPGFGPMHRGAYSMMGVDGKATSWYAGGQGPVRDIAAARAQAQRFAGRIGLRTAEVMQFANHFYVLLDDKQGRAATEVLVDPRTGAVTLEYGPAMMWNTRYGMMGGTAGGGMMGGGMMGGSGMMGSGGGPSWAPAPGDVGGPLSAAQAQQVANRWLAAERPGTTASRPEALPGYFTIDTRRDGKVEGMLSVDERTGAVWYHWWHGRFVAMEE